MHSLEDNLTEKIEMKKFIATALLIVISTNAYCDEQWANNGWPCSLYADMAEIIAGERQKNTPVKDVRNELKKLSFYATHPMIAMVQSMKLKDITKVIYSWPVYETEEDKQQFIKDKKKECFAWCEKAKKAHGGKTDVTWY